MLAKVGNTYKHGDGYDLDLLTDSEALLYAVENALSGDVRRGSERVVWFDPFGEGQLLQPLITGQERDSISLRSLAYVLGASQRDLCVFGANAQGQLDRAMKPHLDNMTAMIQEKFPKKRIEAHWVFTNEHGEAYSLIVV